MASGLYWEAILDDPLPQTLMVVLIMVRFIFLKFWPSNQSTAHPRIHLQHGAATSS
jgi:hypothetical protein